MIITTNKGSLYNGINQQSAEYRRDNQVEDMVNCLPTINDGVHKRNATKIFKELKLGGWYYTYSRGDGTESYMFNVNKKALRVINLKTGDESRCPVHPYLTGENFRAITVKDKTFIVNKDIKPKLKPSATVKQPQGFVWIKSANPTVPYQYSMTIDGTAYSVSGNSTGEVAKNLCDALNKGVAIDPADLSTYTTELARLQSELRKAKVGMSSGHATDSWAVQVILLTNAIAGLGVNHAGGKVYHAEVVGSVVKISGIDFENDFTINDSYGNMASFAWTDSVNTVGDLPKNLGFNGYRVKVVARNGQDGYWLKYDHNQWKESTGMGNYSIEIDPASMPHIITRNANGTFDIKEYEWAYMKTGDVDSNAPSVIFEEEITDIFFFKNRLGFITPSGVAFSEVGKYGNFWRTTCVTLLDSDPISTYVDTTRVIRLEHILPLENEMLIFSQNSQFILKGDKIISPKDISISQASAYNVNTDVRPISVNNKIFFASNRGEYTCIMEYEVTKQGVTSVASDITAHIQEYLPKNITRLVSSPQSNFIICSIKNSKDLYCYKYYDNGDERMQSAWFRWEYNGLIDFIDVVDDELFIYINRQNEIDYDTGGVWDDDKVWDDDDIWLDYSSQLSRTPQLEKCNLTPDYYDNFFVDCDGSSVSAPIKSMIALGEWVYRDKNKAYVNAKLQHKTINIKSASGSEFIIGVKDRERYHEIPVKHTINRKPLIFGSSKNVRIEIMSESDRGFKIFSITLEGNLNKRGN